MSAAHSLPKGVSKIVSTLIVLFVIAFFSDHSAQSLFDYTLPEKTPNSVGTFYKVTRVVDGDTIRIDFDGTEEVVRLLGINTPESVDPRRKVECFGVEASKKMKDLLSSQLVRLEFDSTQSYRDTYGRLLAYVYLEDGQMINRKMIAEGYAYEYTYLHPYKYQKEFRDVQRFAKSSEYGLWAKDSCNGQK